MHTDTEIVPAELAVEPQKPSDSVFDHEASVATVRKYLDAAQKFARCSAAMQVMAGFEMVELKKLGGWVQGGRRGQKPNRSGFAEYETWEDFCAKQLGISGDTARTYIALAEAARPRLKKLQGFGGLLEEILQRPVTQIEPEKAEMLNQAVHKLTDGKTQLELFRDWGLAKKAPVAATGGALGGAGAPRIERTEAEIRDLALRQWRDVMGMTESASDSFVHLDDAHQISLALHLERLLEAVKWWMSIPASRRGPATRQELKNRLKLAVA